MRWFLALSLIGGFAAAGCTTHNYDHRDAMVPQSEAGVSQDGKYAQADPVCGTRVNPRGAYTEDWGGRTWWFDSEECARKFHDEPVAYVGTRVDPVCSMVVETRPAGFKTTYEGKTYFFDSMECMQKFHGNPTAYSGIWIDPVCHKRVEAKEAPFQVEPGPYKAQYGGRTYYFDSKECWQKFQDDPTAYVPAQGKPSEAEVK